MIDQLHAVNVALIRDATMEFSDGLTVLTGETGAGKTALLSALKLLIGERADSGAIREGAKSMIVEGRFFPKEDNGEDGTVVRRQIDAHGRGRVSIDGHMASVRELAESVGSTVDLCGQHEHQRLLQPQTHADLLDGWLARRATEAQDEYRSALAASHAAAKELARVRDAALHANSRADEAAFVLKRIDDVRPSLEEYHELEEEIPRAVHADALLRATETAHDALSGDAGALDSLDRALTVLDDVASLDAKLEQQMATLRSSLLDVEDVARELRSYADDLDTDPSALDAMQSRMAAMQGLMRSYGPRLEDVLRQRAHAAEIVAASRDGAGAEKAALEAFENAETRLAEAARKVNAMRSEGAPTLARAISEELPKLAMGNASVDIAVEPLPRKQWTVAGPSQVEILYRPAKGMSARPLRRIASGGEISRVMLACKVVLGSDDAASTLVFDEVDAGVGGATAVALGNVLARLAATHQVIVVTHLAQVAVLAERHYVVRKQAQDSDEVPETIIREVCGDERVEEVARMLSGGIDELSCAHAREMLAHAH